MQSCYYCPLTMCLCICSLVGWLVAQSTAHRAARTTDSTCLKWSQKQTSNINTQCMWMGGWLRMCYIASLSDASYLFAATEFRAIFFTLPMAILFNLMSFDWTFVHKFTPWLHSLWIESCDVCCSSSFLSSLLFYTLSICLSVSPIFVLHSH